jgi:hypothetical protein
MEEDYKKGGICVQMVWGVAGLDSGGVPRPLFRPGTDHACPQKPNPSRETFPLKLRIMEEDYMKALCSDGLAGLDSGGVVRPLLKCMSL